MLQEVRKNRGLSQSKLAEKSGVNVRLIQHYEQGFKNIDNAKLDIITSLALALDCKLWDILRDEKLIDKVKRTHQPTG